MNDLARVFGEDAPNITKSCGFHFIEKNGNRMAQKLPHEEVDLFKNLCKSNLQS